MYNAETRNKKNPNKPKIDEPYGPHYKPGENEHICSRRVSFAW